jgi:hypothetical protein
VLPGNLPDVLPIVFFLPFSPFWHPAMRIVCPSAESFEERRSFDFFVAVID